MLLVRPSAGVSAPVGGRLKYGGLLCLSVAMTKLYCKSKLAIPVHVTEINRSTESDATRGLPSSTLTTMNGEDPAYSPRTLFVSVFRSNSGIASPVTPDSYFGVSLMTTFNSSSLMLVLTFEPSPLTACSWQYPMCFSRSGIARERGVHCREASHSTVAGAALTVGY